MINQRGISNMAKKHGRPIGGKHPEALREYWRITQQHHRIQSFKNADKELQAMSKATWGWSRKGLTAKKEKIQ
jgi:hypothetical protein